MTQRLSVRSPQTSSPPSLVRSRRPGRTVLIPWPLPEDQRITLPVCERAGEQFFLSIHRVWNFVEVEARRGAPDSSTGFAGLYFEVEVPTTRRCPCPAFLTGRIADLIRSIEAFAAEANDDPMRVRTPARTRTRLSEAEMEWL